MLVLSRKKGERICIGEHIEVSVIAIRGNCVKLAFAAPQDVSIRRAELSKRTRASQTGSNRLVTHCS